MARDSPVTHESASFSRAGFPLAVIRRGRTDIIASLLEAAKEGKSRTHLMYASELDSRGLRKYLDFLVSRKFVEREHGSLTLYKTTAKGLEFLEAHKKIQSLQTL